jgi:poly(3-hydroxybutyrate) depolymerase
MRTPARFCQLVALSAAVTLAACTGSNADSGSGGNGTGGTGNGGSPATGGQVGSGSGGASGTGGGSGGAPAPSDGGADIAPGVIDGGGGDGRAAAIPSTGCGQPAGQALTMYVRKNIMVKNTARVYDLYLPIGYDPMRVYPLIMTSHGCDGSIPFRIERVTKADAIIVAPRTAGGGCFNTGPGSSSLVEVDYFDVMLADVEAKTCVDKARVFHTGHSSGSWLSNLLGCARAGVTTGPSGGLRGQGNTAGGMPVLPACTGPIAAILAHDMTDNQNAFHLGELARDRILKVNGCGTETVPWDYDGDPATPSPCVMYQGCMPGFPVVWCPTNGKGHSDQVGPPFPGISTVGFWRFWSQF